MDGLADRWRRQLHAPWETAVAQTDQQVASLVQAGLLPPWSMAAWEQWKAAERARKRLPAADEATLQELDF
jgi:hypothetical protein